MKEDIERYYPKLIAAGYEKTSDETILYNCIAWAVGDTSQWWECGENGPLEEPGIYWPPDALHSYDLDALISAYNTLGYEICEIQSPEPELGYQKVVLYKEGEQWRHAAKLLENGLWSSKLGDLEDVSHVRPEDAEGAFNGEVACYMRRKLQE